jgi:DNA-binding GntR family transcriptional regulator
LVLLVSLGGLVPEPTYRQIAEDLRRKIEFGDIGRGDQLPTELELRGAYEASRNTVRDAVMWLQFSVTVGDVPALAAVAAIHDQAVGISSGRSHA